ncbi:hypothetical protein MMC16_004547 [Acarospora aff. strigata]|nr:hypothetical protein [Acarospora aff. strigata]
MAAETAAHPEGNGFTFSEEELKEVLEYEKILRLRDEIFAGKHAQLKVSAHAVVKTAPRIAQSPSIATPRATINGEASKVCQPSTPASTSGSSRGQVGHVKEFVQNSPNAQRTSTSGTGSSAIDPIFLTKSEDLVKAEIQLQRQRIERALEEQVYQRKVLSRQRISDQEAVPDFNISEVFAKALDIVKPTSSAETNGANATATSSDSFDENTFYSSQVNDSPLDETDNASGSPMAENQAQARAYNSVDTDDQLRDRSGPAQRNGNLADGVPAQDRRLHDLEDLTYITLQSGNQGVQKGRSQYYTQEHGDAHEEPDYSPPAADEAIPLDRNGHVARTDGEQSSEHQPLSKQSRGQVRNDSLRRAHARPKQTSPPPSNVRIVRNHITSPLAPQPARVSPLAVAKVPQLPQNQRHGQDHHSARGARVVETDAGPSPEAPPPQLNPRKRRRAPDAERPRKATVRRVEESPEPYIKPEPVSPPPFSVVPTLAPAQNRQRAARPIYVDTMSPVEVYPGPLQQRRFQTSSGAYGYPLESPNSPIIRQVPSRMAHVSRRDEPDLRRVASVQYVRHPQSPTLDPIQYSPVDVQPARQSSHAFVERPPAREQYHYYRDPLPRNGRYVRPERSLTPPQYRTAYADIDQALPIMAPPPPRRIVMDQYGNKYYEAPRTVNVRSSAAPPARYADVEPTYERVSARQAPIRAGSTILEPYEDMRYGQRLAPSSPPQQRVLAQHHDDGTNHRTYRGLDYPEQVLVPRNTSGHVLDYPVPRHASHFDGISSSREPIARISSVRPVSSRYEFAPDYAPRVQSVHPDQQGFVRLPRRHDLPPARVRELSVRVDHEPQVRGEYVTTGRPGCEYEVQSHSGQIPEQRDSREVIMMDSPLGDDRRQAR